MLSKRRTWVYNLKCTTYRGHNMALGELFHIASLGYPTFEMVGQHCLPPGVKREDSVTQCMSTSQHASILSKVLLNFLFFFPHYFYYDYNSLPSSSFSLSLSSEGRSPGYSPLPTDVTNNFIMTAYCSCQSAHRVKKRVG